MAITWQDYSQLCQPNISFQHVFESNQRATEFRFVEKPEQKKARTTSPVFLELPLCQE